MMTMKMMMAMTVRLSFVVMAVTTVTAFNRRNNRNGQLTTNELIQTLRTIRRGASQCLETGTKCFSSIQCCDGLVCAAFDDFSGENPEIPGFCIKEKDLQPCVTDLDCDGPGSYCLQIGRVGEKYCVTEALSNDIDQLAAIIPSRKFGHAVQFPRPRIGPRLGSECMTSLDCGGNPEVKIPLCCKDVRRGRQGIKRMCDRIETLSPCL